MIKHPSIGVEERLRLLDSALVFSAVDRQVLEIMAQGMAETSYRPGQVVVAEGEEADKLFVIAEGRAEVSVRGGGQDSILAVLGKGEVFGEMAFFSKDRRRQATVKAIGDLHLLFLEAASFMTLGTRFPELLDSLKQMADTRMRLNFLKQFSPFQSVSPEKILDLLSKLERRSVEPGTTLISQGETGLECYLIVSGTMEVLLKDGELPARRIATLYPGSILGEAALLTEEPRNATVRTIESCELLVIRREVLLETMRQDGELDERFLGILRQRDRPRRMENIAVQEQRTADGDILRVLKNPERGTYVRLSREGWFIWERLDGHHTLKDLTLDFMSE